MTDSLAQSLVDAAAEAIAEAFSANLIGYVGKVDGREITFCLEDIHFVRSGDGPSLWEHMARAALAVVPEPSADAARKALFDHADQLMASAADLYLTARRIREGRCP